MGMDAIAQRNKLKSERDKQRAIEEYCRLFDEEVIRLNLQNNRCRDSENDCIIRFSEDER